MLRPAEFKFNHCFRSVFIDTFVLLLLFCSFLQTARRSDTVLTVLSLLLFCEVGLSVSFICSVFIGKAGDSCGIFCLCVLKLHFQRRDLIPLGKENTQIYLKTNRVVLCIYFVLFSAFWLFSRFLGLFLFLFPATVRCEDL